MKFTTSGASATQYFHAILYLHEGGNWRLGCSENSTGEGRPTNNLWYWRGYAQLGHYSRVHVAPNMPNLKCTWLPSSRDPCEWDLNNNLLFVNVYRNSIFFSVHLRHLLVNRYLVPNFNPEILGGNSFQALI